MFAAELTGWRRRDEASTAQPQPACRKSRAARLGLPPR